jgi:hypothetical protein
MRSLWLVIVPESAYVGQQEFDLVLAEFLFEGRHVAAPMIYGIDETTIIVLILPS